MSSAESIDRSTLLAELHAENQQWEELLGQISIAHMAEPTVAAGWSIKDIVAHLTGWRQRTVNRLQAAANGVPEPAPPWPHHLRSDEEINAWIYEQNHACSVEAVLAASRRTYAQLVAAIEALPAAAFIDPHYFPWLEGEPLRAAAFFAHFHEEHEPDIRAWLAEQRTTRM
jgi:hypothetical protein